MFIDSSLFAEMVGLNHDEYGLQWFTGSWSSHAARHENARLKAEGIVAVLGLTLESLLESGYHQVLCCPFFDFGLEIEREGGAVWLSLTGREGVKPFILAEIGDHLPRRP